MGAQRVTMRVACLRRIRTGMQKGLVARHCSAGNGKKELTDLTVVSNDTVSRSSSGGLGEILRSLLQREEDLPDQPFDVFHAECELAVSFDYPSASRRELKFRVQQKLSEFDDLGPSEMLAFREGADAVDASHFGAAVDLVMAEPGRYALFDLLPVSH